MSTVHTTVQRLLESLEGAGKGPEGLRKLLFCPPASLRPWLPTLPALAALRLQRSWSPAHVPLREIHWAAPPSRRVPPELAHLGSLGMGRDTTRGEVSRAPSSDGMLGSSVTGADGVWLARHGLEAEGANLKGLARFL